MKVDQYATYIRVNAGTLTNAQMAEHIGCTTAQVKRFREVHKILGAALQKRAIDTAGEEYIRRNWRHKTDAEMAANFGCAPNTIREARYRLKLLRPTARQAGTPKRAMEERTKGFLDMAADYVATHDRCAVFALPDGNWRYGTARITADELMHKARRKGWQTTFERVAA